MSKYPAVKFDLLARSAIVRSERIGKGLEGALAPTPHQMNRLTGYLSDGRKVVVAQRPGKGGMDFNKLLNGRAFAVAADALSPVFEKDDQNKRTKVQKLEEGLPLYSTSGFYLLSSKEYPALHLTGAYTRLSSDGEILRMLTPAQMAERSGHHVCDDFGLDVLIEDLTAMLDDAHNLVKCHDADSNKKRKRLLERAREDAEAEGEAFEGPAFSELAVSNKDGNPFVLLCWRAPDGAAQAIPISRDLLKTGTDGRRLRFYLTAQEAVARFCQSPHFERLEQAATQPGGAGVEVALIRGHSLRTSVSFKKKVENALAAAPEKAKYGDAVYLLSTMAGWTRGLVSVMHTVHPNFPRADYDSLHYVASCRQAEVGMDKTGNGWTPPKVPHYDLAEMALASSAGAAPL